MGRYEGEPWYSCPEFDDAIKHIEAARTINDTLREDNRRMDREIDSLKDQVSDLENTLRDRDASLDALREELDEFYAGTRRVA